ncbi:MAG TPA: hypothetical protein VFO19_08695 [Vicinamibacterales bacterium]|jgi:hypothetical protein|nr:hypothetical protein [Vicinamibacterales bacterium]
MASFGRRSHLRILTAAVLAAASAALVPAPVQGWGLDVHRYLMRRAIDNMPGDLRPFLTQEREFIGEHVADPDLWRIVGLRTDLGDEDPNHFLDIDGLDEPPPFHGVPREWHAYVARYGAERANRMGRLPWRIEDVYQRLVKAFADIGKGVSPYAASNARYLTAVLGHYVQDANQPFHAVLNYDGQLTGQRGIHSRFETQVVLRNLSNLKLAAVEVRPVGAIREYAFATVVESQTLVAGILEADLAAKAGRTEYDDEYFRLFMNGVRRTLERRLSDATSATVSVVVAAWTEAGRPDLLRREPRPPQLRLRQ